MKHPDPLLDDLAAGVPWEHTRALLQAIAGVDRDEAIAALGAVLRALSRPTRRGGDPFAKQRRDLHEGLRAMASLLGQGKPVAETAREVIDRCNRYQPLPVETDPLRRAMQKVIPRQSANVASARRRQRDRLAAKGVGSPTPWQAA